MLTVQKYLNLLSNTNDETALDKKISKLSEPDAKQVLKTMIEFLNERGIENDFIQFSQEQIHK